MASSPQRFRRRLAASAEAGQKQSQERSTVGGTRLSSALALSGGEEVREPGLGALPRGVCQVGEGRQAAWCKRQVFPLSVRHGEAAVAACLSVAAASYATLALDAAIGELDLRRALFLDTETTGLSVHGGSVAFLVGLGRFEDDTFVLEQWFLRSPGGEPAMLSHIAERLRDATSIVSFNGKSYDFPLLRSRFLRSRVPMPRVSLHLDLLHCARRVYKRRLKRVPLVGLERKVLRIHRQDDIAGEDIPERYFGYLRHGDAAVLEDVLTHNAWDLLALPALLGHLGVSFEAAGDGCAGAASPQEISDLFSYAKVAERGKDPRKAQAFAAAAARLAPAPLAGESMLLKARACRRLGEGDGERRALRDALEMAPQCDALGSAEIHLAVAKYLEHRARDFVSALLHAKETAHAEGEEACERRIARLERRAGR